MSVTTTIDATNQLQVRLYAPQATIYWDNVMLECGTSVLNTYFDGNTTGAGTSYSWTGPTNLSASIAVPTPIPISTGSASLLGIG